MKKSLHFFLISFTIFFSCIGEVFAQDKNTIDSLKQLIVTGKQDKDKVNTLLKLGDHYTFTKPDTALIYYHKALDVSEEIKIDKLIGKCFRYIGIIYYYQGIDNKAISYYLKSLEAYKKIDDKMGVSGSYNNIGLVYKNQGDYNKALENYLRSLKIVEEIGEKKRISFCYINIGGIHELQGSYDKAISYFRKSLKIAKEIGDKKVMAGAYNCIGATYNYNAVNDSIAYYHLKSLQVSEEIGDKIGMSNSYTNLGIYYYEQDSHDTALNYYLKSLKISEEIGNVNGVTTAYSNISSLYIRLANSQTISKAQRTENLNKAVESGNKAYKLAKETGAMFLQQKNAEYLMTAYRRLRKHKKALEYAAIYITTTDSLFNEEKTKELAKIEAQYIYRKQAEIDSIAHINAINIKDQALLREKEVSKVKVNTFIIIGSIILIVTFLVIYLQRGRLKKNNMIAKQEKMLSEANLRNKELENRNLLSELEYKNKEVVNFALHIVEKNDFLEQLQKTIAESDKQQNYQQINKLIVQNLSIEKDRKEFKANVENVNEAFFLKLEEKFPKLTKNEKRLCALLRLNLSSKEIATIQNISPSSVNINRHRLRKKLNIPEEVNLSEFLNKVI